MKVEKINQLLKITESYKAPDAMLNLVLSESRNELFKDFLDVETDLSYEWFQSYFENEHSDRKVKKQDFTPNSVSSLLSQLVGKRDSYFEATAGTGGIAIQFWNHNPEAWFKLEELSDRAIPFLVFNMAIRGVNGVILHGDSITREFKDVYFIRNMQEQYGAFSEVIVMPKTEILMNELNIMEWVI